LKDAIIDKMSRMLELSREVGYLPVCHRSAQPFIVPWRNTPADQNKVNARVTCVSTVDC
jgi:hypothetical protein